MAALGRASVVTSEGEVLAGFEAPVLDGTNLKYIEIDGDQIIRNSTIDKIVSKGRLLLVNCTVKEVSARRLIMLDCFYKRAESELDMIVRYKVSANGVMEVYPIHAKGDIQAFLPPTKSVFYTKTTFKGNITNGKGIEQVELRDCQVDGDIIFAEDGSSVVKKATLSGDSHLKGKVIGGILVDESDSNLNLPD